MEEVLYEQTYCARDTHALEAFYSQLGLEYEKHDLGGVIRFKLYLPIYVLPSLEM